MTKIRQKRKKLKDLRVPVAVRTQMIGVKAVTAVSSLKNLGIAHQVLKNYKTLEEI
jgi:hypothetical protein